MIDMSFLKNMVVAVFTFVDNHELLCCLAGSFIITIVMNRWFYSYFHKGETAEDLKKDIIINQRAQIDIREFRVTDCNDIMKHIYYQNTYYIKPEKNKDVLAEDRTDTGELPDVIEDVYVKIQEPIDIFECMTAYDRFKRLRIKNNSDGEIALARINFAKRPSLNLYKWEQYLLAPENEIELLINIHDEPEEIVIDYNGTDIEADIREQIGFAQLKVGKKKNSSGLEY